MKEHAEGKAIEVFRQAMGHRSSRVPVGAIIEACEAYALALKPVAPKDDPAIVAALKRYREEYNSGDAVDFQMAETALYAAIWGTPK